MGALSSMTLAIIVVVALYALSNLVLGLISQARSKDTSSDYFISGRSLGWFHLGLTFLATWYSTFAFIGAPGFYYEKGISWLAVQGAFTVGSLPLMWFIGRKIWLRGRKHGYITPADLLAHHYDSRFIRYATAVLCIFALIPYCLIQLTAIGKVLSSSTNGAVPYEAGVILTVFVAAFYTFTGGVRAIVWTDIIQGVLFTLVIVFAAGVSIHAAGGLGEGYAASIAEQSDVFRIDPMNFGSAFTTAVIWSFGFILLPHLWQRTYMAQSGSSFTRSMVVQGILGFVLVSFLMVSGTLAIGYMGEVSDPDKLVSTMFSEHLPAFIPFLVLATFAAGMSTLDSQLLTASSVVVRDLSKSQAGEAASAAAAGERRRGRYTVLTLLAVLMVLALTPQAQGPIIVLASKGIGVAFMLLVPVLGALFWPRVGRQAASVGLVAGPLTLLVLEVTGVKLPLGFGPPIAACLVQLACVAVLPAPASARSPAFATQTAHGPHDG